MNTALGTTKYTDSFLYHFNSLLPSLNSPSSKTEFSYFLTIIREMLSNVFVVVILFLIILLACLFFCRETPTARSLCEKCSGRQGPTEIYSET